MSLLANMIKFRVDQNDPKKNNNSYTGQIYQIFGFDILIDKHFNSWLLEINDHPSMNVYACKAAMGCAHKQCPVSQVDMYVKKQVLEDTIKLILKHKNKQPEEYRNLQRIFPEMNPPYDEVFRVVK